MRLNSIMAFIVLIITVFLAFVACSGETALGQPTQTNIIQVNVTLTNQIITNMPQTNTILMIIVPLSNGITLTNIVIITNIYDTNYSSELSVIGPEYISTNLEFKLKATNVLVPPASLQYRWDTGSGFTPWFENDEIALQFASAGVRNIRVEGRRRDNTNQFYTNTFTLHVIDTNMVFDDFETGTHEWLLSSGLYSMTRFADIGNGSFWSFKAVGTGEIGVIRPLPRVYPTEISFWIKSPSVYNQLSATMRLKQGTNTRMIMDFFSQNGSCFMSHYYPNYFTSWCYRSYITNTWYYFTLKFNNQISKSFDILVNSNLVESNQGYYFKADYIDTLEILGNPNNPVLWDDIKIR